MLFQAEIDVMPRKELLDPQGKAVQSGFKNLHLEGIRDVRIGKHISLTVEAADEAEARSKVDEACSKLLANPVMESYSYALHKMQEA